MEKKAVKAKEAMLKMCEAMMKKVEEMTPEEAAKLVEECGLVYYEENREEVVESFDFPEIKGEMEISEVGMEMLLSFSGIKEKEEWKPTTKQQEVLDAYQKKLDNLTEEEIKAT